MYLCPCADVLTLLQKVGLGATAGALAAIVGTPADVSLVRMQVSKRHFHPYSRSHC